MAARHAFYVAVVAAALLASTPSPVLAQVGLTHVASGFTDPVFVGHAGDGSNRLFIVERAGRIRVLLPGATMGIEFLNITPSVSTTGEQGLLGLAFHPQYATNRRFFVFYTRKPDGAIRISEFRATSDPNLADHIERPLLTIPHPGQANHNGGMIAFGNDGLLYIAVGDGGSGNDPPNNAQNLNVLLGKILRINVNTPSGYLIPASNPFAGATPGLDEIYAYGLRNPWRFSVDRSTGQLWVGDVGQGSKEEIDTPIVAGGNYGWRVFEGVTCTGNGPAACNPAAYSAPVIEYTHDGGRCSVTGGNVYRGSKGTLTPGTYIYGDFCTGEVFASSNGIQSRVFDTSQNISSFGEDQAGELYLVGYASGAIYRFIRTQSTTPPSTPPTAGCTYVINPTARNAGWRAESSSVAVSAGAGCQWTATTSAAWLRVTSGAAGNGNGSVGYRSDANPTTVARTGRLTIAGRSFTVNQAAAPPCTFTLSPTSASFGSAGRTLSLYVETRMGCAWTAKSNVSWITVTYGKSGNGNGDVVYVVAANNGSSSRTGTLTVAGKTFKVVQGN